MRAYLELLRLPNLFTAVADVAMGFLFTHAALAQASVWRFATLAAASVSLYAGGVVLNDVFDLAVDARQRPHRPLPSGRVPLGVARWLGWELLLVGMAFGWLGASWADDLRPAVVATSLAGCIVLYDGVLKRTPLGPVVMGGCRLLNVLLGMSVSPGPWRDEHWLVAASIGVYIAGVTWFSRREAGESSRWQLGLATAAMLSGIGLLWLVPGRCDRVIPLLARQPARWTLLMALLGLMIGWRCARAIVEPAPERVQTAVKQCILSLVILDAAAALVIHGIRGAVLVLILLVPTVVAGWWIEST